MPEPWRRLAAAGGALPRTNPMVVEAFAAARPFALDSQNSEGRITAIEFLFQRDADSGAALLSLFNPKEPQEVQLAAISALARFNDPQVGPALVQRWESFTPRLRSEALAALLARADRAVVLLQAIEAGTIRGSVLDTAQVKFLRNHRDKAVQELRSSAGCRAAARGSVIDSFMPALDVKGKRPRQKIYQERCISCHRRGRRAWPTCHGQKHGQEKMLVNILDPNREVRPEFVSYVIETNDDESSIGLVVSESATAVTLRQAYGKEDVIRRGNIRKMQSQGQSLMPEGLEVGLTSKDLADLLEYIETAEAK
jgi:putative heme-binding domain-containing protein